MIKGQIKPIMAIRRLPMILPAEKSVTTDGPFGEIINHAKHLEQQAEILSASAFYVQPWLDTPEVAASVIVVTDNRRDRAEQEAERLAELFWQKRVD
jgi:microcystin degradation protein MlrC